jgi:hypothetical protein
LPQRCMRGDDRPALRRAKFYSTAYTQDMEHLVYPNESTEYRNGCSQTLRPPARRQGFVRLYSSG